MKLHESWGSLDHTATVTREKPQTDAVAVRAYKQADNKANIPYSVNEIGVRQDLTWGRNTEKLHVLEPLDYMVMARSIGQLVVAKTAI